MAAAETRPHAEGSPFWRFSLGFYRLPEVADACIRLQDEAGVDVNLLLYLLWQAALERKLSRNDVAAIEERIAPWREQVVVPLRTVRRAIKIPPPAIDPGTAEAYRSKIKGIELEGERLQQEALYDLGQSANLGAQTASPAEAARDNIDAYQAICARPFPPDAVAAVLAAFSSFEQRAGTGRGAH